MLKTTRIPHASGSSREASPVVAAHCQEKGLCLIWPAMRDIHRNMGGSVTCAISRISFCQTVGVISVKIVP